MNSAGPSPRPSNPFATRFIRPGAIAYRFADGVSGDELVRRLAANAWHGQIIGPHGSGKSTLLAALAEPLAVAGRTVHTIGLHDGQRQLPAGWRREMQTAGADLLIIDGYEQLSRLSGWLVRWHIRRRGWGLLVTAHDDVGLPNLLTTRSTLNIATEIVGELSANSRWQFDAAQIEAEYCAAGGNIREMLFRLYDRWETLSRDTNVNRTSPPL